MTDPGELFDLAGQVAIVTGSSRGLGRAIAEGFSRAGASVVVTSRKQDGCDAVAAEISKATGRDVIGLACHVGDWQAIPGVVEQVVKACGRIDILVNNAESTPHCRACQRSSSICGERSSVSTWRALCG